ncbi:MAG TPA: hypothetical protein VJI96_04520 [Candidatus Andersenbacteria bacterium]|nr:hypothetical protein [Candidatus Andersenbacteria bacterium]
MKDSNKTLMPDAPCAEIQRLLPDYLRSASAVPVGQRGVILQHISTCTECRNAYQALIHKV